MSTFNERFRQLKNQFNLTNKDLAKIIGVSSSTVTKWLNGLIKPNAIKLYTMCIFFKVSSDYILGLKD